MVQWLGLLAPTAEGPGSIQGRGTKIPHAAQHGLNKEKRKRKKKNLWFQLVWGPRACGQHVVTICLGGGVLVSTELKDMHQIITYIPLPLSVGGTDDFHLTNKICQR